MTVCLIDGLHTYRQSLRDVLNASDWMHPHGVIVVDDCNPKTLDRANPTPTGKAWNGEVWKTMATLKSTQPQWSVRTLDTDEGVGLVLGFQNKRSNVSDLDIASFDALDFSHLQKHPEIVGLQAAGG